MRVCFVVGGAGEKPHCGVRDYSVRLAGEMERVGVHAEVRSAPKWDAGSFMQFCKNLRSARFDVVHIQYPSIGFKWSLAPHLLGVMKVAKKTVVTMHDYSTLPFIQRFSTHLFRWTADSILFTTDFERQRYSATLGSFGASHDTAPIGSNVPAHSRTIPRNRTVVYFGQVKPGKGIESFLELARLATRQRYTFQFLIMGSVPVRYTDYFAEVRALSPSAVKWRIDLSFAEIAEVMTGSLAAYLPFPDGAGYRRGSMLAALVNGLPVITPCGAATPPELADVLMCANSPAEALTCLKNLENPARKTNAIRAAMQLFALRFSWPEIAGKHQVIYEGLQGREALGRQAVLNLRA